MVIYGALRTTCSASGSSNALSGPSTLLDGPPPATSSVPTRAPVATTIPSVSVSSKKYRPVSTTMDTVNSEVA
ncbi:hypothetical protein BDZ89DRAFT_1081309 [Hymenopellis radicata]|nr:hypothetical protein BDZ89DRAFT_1081309 [Hymenopellis radicata]